MAATMLCAATLASAQTERLPAAPELDGIADELRGLVQALERDNLPSDLVVMKVREGLAKRVEPQRILTAAYAAAYDARIVARLVTLHVRAPAERARALAVGVSARAAGITVSGIDAMLRQSRRVGEATAIAAVDTAADLVAAGYPTGRSTDLVAGVLARPNPARALPLVLAEVEATRQATGASRTLAVDAIADYVELGNGLAVSPRLSRSPEAAR